MSKVYIATKDDLNQTRIDLAARFAVAEQGVATGTQPVNMDSTDGTPVGRVVFDCVLRQGYVKANGATIANASQDYPRLVEFVLAHPELLAADDEAHATNTALYMYNVTSDVMTLPNYIGRVMQGGNAVVSVEAGLPNITGAVNAPYGWGQRGHSGALATYTTTTNSSTPSYSTSAPMTGLNIDASRSNAIYGASTTVQPPAVMLIPQIRY